MLLKESVLFLVVFCLLAEGTLYVPVLDSNNGSEPSGFSDSGDKLLRQITELGTQLTKMETEFESQMKEMKTELATKFTKGNKSLDSQSALQESNEFSLSADSDDEVLQEIKELGTHLTTMKTELGLQMVEITSLETQMAKMKTELGGQMKEINKKICHNQTASTEMPRTDCPDGWIRFKSSCYLFGRNMLSFKDAQKYCNSFKASLTNVETVVENTFIKDQLGALAGGSNFWIGMTDESEEGIWRHYPSGKLATFVNWDRFEPDTTQYDCAVFYKSYNYFWIDYPCTSKNRPVCEKKAVIWEKEGENV